MSHLNEASELKREYPKETTGFDVFQVERIWEEYSDSLAAGWIMPDKETVAEVFDAYRSLLS